ncbi:HAD-IA family hydrolase [Pseudomonas aeruginosa]|nr:HAD-IA family hydrolase [Pseudomonas aeruginosa]
MTRSKPDPEPLLLACSQLGIDPSRVLFIGDDLRDIESGRDAGTNRGGALRLHPPRRQPRALGRRRDRRPPARTHRRSRPRACDC